MEKKIQLFGLENSIYICFVKTNFILNEKYFYLSKEFVFNANNHIFNLQINLIGLPMYKFVYFKEIFSLCISTLSAKCVYP